MNDSIQVRDLIEQLQRFDPRAQVYLRVAETDEDGICDWEYKAVDSVTPHEFAAVCIRSV